jgi:hypothetical protein
LSTVSSSSRRIDDYLLGKFQRVNRKTEDFGEKYQREGVLELV